MKFDKKSVKVFDRDTLGSEIQTNKDKIREHRQSKERIQDEERRKLDREEYIANKLRRKG